VLHCENTVSRCVGLINLLLADSDTDPLSVVSDRMFPQLNLGTTWIHISVDHSVNFNHSIFRFPRLLIITTAVHL
jgi:hypothetical protein